MSTIRDSSNLPPAALQEVQQQLRQADGTADQNSGVSGIASAQGSQTVQDPVRVDVVGPGAPSVTAPVTSNPVLPPSDMEPLEAFTVARLGRMGS